VIDLFFAFLDIPSSKSGKGFFGRIIGSRNESARVIAQQVFNGIPSKIQ
jgi:hypothetical protein